MIVPVWKEDLDEQTLKQWFFKIAHYIDIKNFYDDINNLSIWKSKDFICCVEFSNGVLFISHLANLSDSGKVKDFLKELSDIYKPVFIMGFRKGSLLVYNNNRIRKIPRQMVEIFLQNIQRKEE